jgi:hypothetical protein
MWASWLQWLFATPLAGPCLFVDQSRDGVALVTDGHRGAIVRTAHAREGDRWCPAPTAVENRLPARAEVPDCWLLHLSGDQNVR